MSAAAVSAITVIACERLASGGRMGRLSGDAATVAFTADGNATTWSLSRLDGEPDWFVDACSINGILQWANGTGGREQTLRTISSGEVLAAVQAVVARRP